MGYIFRIFKKSEKPFTGTYHNAKEELTYKIKTATRTRLASDAPIGAFLSGGIDSSNLVFIKGARY